MTGNIVEKNEIQQAMIDEVMDYFDFEKVQKVMQFLEWKWATVDGIVQISDLRKKARALLKKCLETKGTVGCGGFESSYINDNLKLMFYVDMWSVHREEIMEDIQSHPNRTTNPHLHQNDVQ